MPRECIAASMQMGRCLECSAQSGCYTRGRPLERAARRRGAQLVGKPKVCLERVQIVARFSSSTLQGCTLRRGETSRLLRTAQHCGRRCALPSRRVRRVDGRLRGEECPTGS